MPTTTLKPKTTKGGSATKASLTNASAEKSRKMLEQMLAKTLSSSTKIPKTMTIKTGATKKSTATRSVSAGATKGRKGGRRGGSNINSPLTEEVQDEAALAEEAAPVNSEIRRSMTFKCDMIDSQAGGYRKKRTYVKKSSCSMSSKRPMSAKPTKKSSCGATTKSTKSRSKSAKK